MNRILIIIPIVILIIGIGSYFGMQSDENIEISQIEQRTELMESPVLIQTNVKSLFKVMAYENDFEMIDGEKIWRNVYYELDESKLDTYQDLKNDKKSAVVFPIFTAAAYSEPGFYTFYRGECDGEFHGMLFRDEDCLTIKINEEYSPSFTSSGDGLQVLNLLNYDIITDITIHQNPEILSSYEKIILLHNEYVTSVEFDAIISHPNVIYLYPNALYAEIDFDEELWEISLVRGHNYPEITIRNGFDWRFDNSLDEYDVACNNMKFSKIDNGWMLNCYPENILHKSKQLLKQIRDF
tara:strand:- start:652 stop:1539 length:888 start_codon:yes stop_codon:yes gene_type:complete